MEKTNKIIYWTVTGIFSLMMLMASLMYILKYDEVSETFIKLTYPTFIIYPLALAKTLGVIAILTRKSKVLKEWAYAGFFFDFLLASGSFISIQDPEFVPPLVAMALLFISYIYDRKVFKD